MPTKTGKRLNLSELFNVRVIQRNLVYVIGLAPEISHEKVINIFNKLGIVKRRLFWTIWKYNKNHSK